MKKIKAKTEIGEEPIQYPNYYNILRQMKCLIYYELYLILYCFISFAWCCQIILSCLIVCCHLSVINAVLLWSYCVILSVWRSYANSDTENYQYQEATLTLILKIISQCDIKHMMMLQIKTIRSVLMILTYTITSIVARPNSFNDLDIHYH